MKKKQAAMAMLLALTLAAGCAPGRISEYTAKAQRAGEAMFGDGAEDALAESAETAGYTEAAEYTEATEGTEAAESIESAEGAAETAHTEVAEGTEEIEVGEELENENGLRFSKLVIKKSQ